MEKLSAFKESVLGHYSRGSQELKTSLIGLFGPRPFILTMSEWEAFILENLKSFEDACGMVEVSPLESRFTTGDPDTIAYEKLKIVFSASNPPDWKADYGDGSQAKWFPVFVWVGSGFRFDDSHFDCSRTVAGGGSRLRLCSEKISNYVGQQFLPLFNQQLI